MGGTCWVSDETWAAIDPARARLAPAQRRVVVGLVVLAMLAALVPVLATLSGVTAPNMALWPHSLAIDRATHSFTVRWQVDNDDWFGETVTGIDLRDRGTSVVAVTPSDLSIPSGQHRFLTARFHVDDCAAPSSFSMLVVVHLSRPWGTQSVELVTGQMDLVSVRRHVDLFMDGAAALACGRHG
ncbi:MAG TPA: hypothetical protein VE442_05175 [Jatrophihabitans sp.]|jgi:hypothetical protein|nr:hypothetical protein [Jatrophihabitans sp.]